MLPVYLVVALCAVVIFPVECNQSLKLGRKPFRCFVETSRKI